MYEADVHHNSIPLLYNSQDDNELYRTANKIRSATPRQAVLDNPTFLCLQVISLYFTV